MNANGIGVRFQGAFDYRGRRLFENIHVTLPAGEWTCLLGVSGVGKSTLLRLIAGLATAGEFQGEIAADDARDVASRAAWMAQSDLLLPWCNVRQNLMLGARLRGESRAQQHAMRARADELIARVGLAGHADKRPHQLSGGMRQRTALARTLMQDTPLVLLDEPFASLDAHTRAQMHELAFDMLRGKTVLLVTHDPGEAVRLAHQLYLMSPHGITRREMHAPPLRAVDDAAVLKAQGEVLRALAAHAPHTHDARE